MRKIINYGLIAFGGLILTGCSLLPSATQPIEEGISSTTEPTATPKPEDRLNPQEGSKPEITTQQYSLPEVAQHSVGTDCWIAIEGKVYDVTSFIASQKHPGKDAILQGCGKDATELYNNRPNGSGAHSDKARSFLPNYYIGDLKQ